MNRLTEVAYNSQGIRLFNCLHLKENCLGEIKIHHKVVRNCKLEIELLYRTSIDHIPFVTSFECILIACMYCRWLSQPDHEGYYIVYRLFSLLTFDQNNKLKIKWVQSILISKLRTVSAVKLQETSRSQWYSIDRKLFKFDSSSTVRCSQIMLDWIPFDNFWEWEEVK